MYYEKEEKNSNILLLKSMGLFLLFLLALLTILSIRRIEFFNTGDDFVILKLNENYHTNPEMKVCNILGCKKIQDAIEVNKIDTSKPGNYIKKYKGFYKNRTYFYEEKIVVIDDISPVINLTGKTIIKTKPNNYIEEGYVAIDNYDGDITSKVKIEQIGNIRRYSVEDSSGNICYVDRIFEYVDTKKPTIKLNGDALIYLDKKEKFVDPGVKVSDDSTSVDDLKITIDGNDDFTKAGSYTITYTVADLAGNTNSCSREIRVYSFDTLDINEYWLSLNYYIMEHNYHLSLGYYNFLNDKTFTYEANKIYYGASLIKTLSALYAYENLVLDSNLTNWVNLAISESDNRSYFNLVKRIGFNNLRNYGKSMGATKVLTGGDYFGSTIVNDQLIFMKYLYNYINTSKNGIELKKYFINDHYNVVKFSNSPTVLHKYGYYGSYFHEDAIFLDDSPYILVILSEEANNDYPSIFKDISEKIYNFNQLVKIENKVGI